MYDSPAPRRGIAWGTVTAGTLALLTVAAIVLVEGAGVRIPFRTAGPGAIIVVGVLILLAGLALVLRSTARNRRAAAAAPRVQGAPVPAPLDATQTPVLGARYDDPSPLDVTQQVHDAGLSPEPAAHTQSLPVPTTELSAVPEETTEIPAEQGSAGDPPRRGHDGGSEAQSSH